MFSLKINKRRGPNKVRGGRKKIEKLVRGEGGGTFIRHLRVSSNVLAPEAYDCSYKNVCTLALTTGISQKHQPRPC